MNIVKEYSSNMLVDVIEVRTATYVGNFVICINFNDGVTQTVDFKPFLNQALHPSIRQYLEESKFQEFTIVDGNLNWNDYDLIFPLEELHKGQISKEKTHAPESYTASEDFRKRSAVKVNTFCDKHAIF